MLASLWGTTARRLRQQLQPAGDGIPSGRADLLEQQVPAAVQATPATVVFAVKDGRVVDNKAEIEKVRDKIAKSPAVLAVADPTTKGAPVPRGRHDHLRPDPVQGSPGDVDTGQVKTMAEDVLTLDGQGGVQVALGGDIIHWSTAEQGGG